MDAYGSDALRFTLARGANPGVDVPIGEEWVQGSRNFCNKLWNAARFALLNGATTAEPLPPAEHCPRSTGGCCPGWPRWPRASTPTTSTSSSPRRPTSLYHFVWDEFCDWYVELAKVPLAAGGDAAHHTRLVLGHALDTVLRLLHPVVPFVTEALWTALTGGESLVVASWPAVDPARRRPGRGGRGRSAAGRGHRDSPVPVRAGAAALAAGRRRGSVGWRRPASPGTSHWCGR